VLFAAAALIEPRTRPFDVTHGSTAAPILDDELCRAGMLDKVADRRRMAETHA
jgi:hypothetical protein